jgi:hypothetical protein
MKTYIDDMVVKSNSITNHLKDLECVLHDYLQLTLFYTNSRINGT